MSPRLLVIVGPTCTGKTAVAVAAALRLRNAELLSADSRQVRRHLHVGTCKPTEAELRGVPCHLLDLCDPGEAFTVADWLRAARHTMSDVEGRGGTPIVVGGTGLYVSALIDGFDLASTPPDHERRAAREAAVESGGVETLAAELRTRDPEAAATIDTRNPRRLIRALEILDAGAASLRTSRSARSLDVTLIGLDAPPDVHTGWVQQRVDAMFAGGRLIEETRHALDAGIAADALTASGIGYAEAVAVVDGTLSEADAIAATVRRTVRYARAQRSYWRRDARVRWLRADLATSEALGERIAGEHPFAILPVP